MPSSVDTSWSGAEAIRALSQVGGFPDALVEQLLPLPGFRNIVVHEYVELDYDRVIAALDALAPIDQFIAAVAKLESPM
jgi:uncharacterized protein YutE (UPF0331/DUF86 family)